ncbi:MAG: PEP/pyruvate-binding domain-containing protein [Thermodesulfobacteriota bacterium]
MPDQWIYWLEELRTGHNDQVGKKCANLGEMTALGMRVPPGFAVSVDGYERFMRETGAGEEIRRYVEANRVELKTVGRQVEASRIIRGVIESKSLPYDMERELVRRYEELSERLGLDRPAVAVRSSGAVSMPGQMETFLNVVGRRELCRHVIKVWSSAFTARAIAFRLESGMDMARAPIGVAVLKMVRAKSAGVALTVLPFTGDTGKIIVEGNWGLGESVVSGEITPDQYIIDKETGQVQSTINPKTKMVVYRSSGTATADVPAELRERPCLTVEELGEIARVAKQVEAHFHAPQDLEWVVDQDLPFPENIFWVQARPAKFKVRKQEDSSEYLAELMTRIFKT